jgi:sigma-E factor negative regulatory protein RseB
MRMRAGRALGVAFCFCCGGLFAQSAAAADEVAVWFERMVQAAHQLNYTGTFVYQQGSALQTMHIVHAVDEDGEHERLVSLSGPAREVIREHDKVTCILPKESPMVVEHAGPPRPFPRITPDNLDTLRRYYDIRLLGSERIAGMKARKITIVPRDEYRYGQNIWLAEDNGLLLRTEVVNEKGQLVEQVMFTSLELKDRIPATMLESQTENPARVVELPAKPAAPETPADTHVYWQVTDLPPGFNQDMQRQHYLPHKSQPVEHHLYSDGLSSVSVFIESADGDDSGFLGSSHIGGVNAYGRRIDTHLATVVGEVPPVTVKRIAESIQPLSGE